MRTAHWTRRGIPRGTLAAVALAIAGVGCELAVSDTVPSYSCVPGVANTCPAGFTCEAERGVCEEDPHVVTTVPEPDAATSEADATIGDAGLVDDRAPDTTSPVDGTVATVAESGGPSEAAVEAASAEASSADAADAGPCVGLGCKCSGDSDCASGICAAELTVSTALYQAAGGASFCTQPCCSSADCPTAGVCFATGAGGSYCVLPQWLDRATPVGSALGLGGATCSTNSDCRSGLCASHACADTCCSATLGSTECGGGAACRVAAFAGVGFDTHVAPSCGPSSSCNGSFLCGPCRNTTQCAPGQGCEYLPTSLGSKDIAATCVATTSVLGEGVHCTGNANCASGFCDPNSNECTDACFADADCTLSGWHCRPEVVQVQSGGSYSVLCCGP
jgi:hypothetical protein